MSRQWKKLLKRARLTERLPLPAGSDEPIAEPLDLVKAFVKAWRVGDADAIAKLFVEDADFVNVVGLWWTSRTSIRKVHRSGFERIFGRSKLTIEAMAERRIGDDVAVIHARWQLSGQLDPNGEPAGPRRGVLSATVVRLADGSWQAVSCQNTDIAPAADTLLAQDGDLRAASYLGGPSVEEVAASELVDDSE